MPSVIIMLFKFFVHSLLRALKQMDMTPLQFTITFLHHSAERQRDVAKEKSLVVQLDRF